MNSKGPGASLFFSKQAVFEVGDTRITLLDTPGHVDFSAEMERTLQVLDYAILVVSGADGVQGHTKTLWHLLEIYKIPVFIFVNKMDQNGTNKDKVINEIKKQLDDRCIEFSEENPEEFFDRLAMCDEMIMETYLEKGRVETSQISAAVKERKVFPCFFGSALKLEGVEEFIHGLMKYTVVPSYPNEFGAKIFKITRDEQGNRLTHMKLTGGKLKVRDVLTNGVWEEKVNQIRIYSGEKFEAVSEVDAGTVFAVTGLTQSRPGEGLGIEKYIKSLLQYHVSTRERMTDFDNFYDPIKKYILESEKIIDIGCGLNPLMVPFNSDGSKVVKYIAADRDKKSVKIIEAYSAWLGDGRLIGVNWDLKEGWQELFKKNRC